MKRQYCLYGRARLYPEGGSKGKSDFHALFLRQTPLQCIKPCTILKFLRSRRPPALDDWRLRKSNCPCRGVECGGKKSLSPKAFRNRSCLRALQCRSQVLLVAPLLSRPSDLRFLSRRALQPASRKAFASRVK